MSRPFAACIVLAVAVPELPAQEKAAPPKPDYPHVYLKNDTLKVKVYLPDAEKGFYRGTRFDWAGVFGEVEFAGHKIFGPWKDTHDPANHDDIVGPCEEFGYEKPLGYDEARPGGTFLKIGVGELEKPDDKPYQFHRKYKIVKPAAWKERPREPVGAEPHSLAWEMSAGLPSGLGYEYFKVVEIDRKEPVVRIHHLLKNTGTRPLSTDFYNHNFFNVDRDPVGPDYRIVFPFDLKTTDLRGRFGELVETTGKELRFKEKLAEGFVMAGLTGFRPGDKQDARFDLRHEASGVRVRVTHTDGFAKVNVWGIRTTICPEPFQTIALEPKQETSWGIVYRFEHDPPRK